MAISLSIPVGLRVPGSYVGFDNSKAVNGLPAAQQKILIIGQRLAAGGTPALTRVKINTYSQAVASFGRGSQLADMIDALKIANRETETWAIALDDDPAGVAATKTVTFTGPATGAGTLFGMIGGRPVRTAVASGDAATAVATAYAAAVNAQPDLTVTAAANAAVVTLTARNKGAVFNDLDVRFNYYQGERYPAGVTAAVATGVTGTGNPLVGGVWAAIGDTAYQTIILPFVDAVTMTAIETELADRTGPLRQIDGFAYGAARGTQGALSTLGSARNSQFSSIIGVNASPSSPWRWAAAYGGVIAFYAQIDPARPFQTLPLSGIVPPHDGSRFTRQERELLLKDGISTFTVDAGDTVLIERPITTYQVDAQGLEDVSYLDVNITLTLFYLRQAVRARVSQRWPRHKLLSDGSNPAPGQAAVRPKDIRAELIALFRDMEGAAIVENIDQFIADLLVERSSTDVDRVDSIIPPDIVNGFRVFGAAIQYRL